MSRNGELKKQNCVIEINFSQPLQHLFFMMIEKVYLLCGCYVPSTVLSTLHTIYFTGRDFEMYPYTVFYYGVTIS